MYEVKLCEKKNEKYYIEKKNQLSLKEEEMLAEKVKHFLSC